MALIKCKECGKEVSEKAEKCPHCGVTICPPKKKTGCLTQLFAVGIFGFIALLIYGACSGEAYKETQKPQTAQKVAPSVQNMYINQPLTVGPFSIKVTQIKETKSIGKYKPRNMYLQVSVEITNTSTKDANAPHFSLHNETVKGLAPCLIDSRLAVDDVKGSIINGEWIKAGETKKGYFPFACDDYVRIKNHPERDSKPADFKMLVDDKFNSKGFGYIWLKNAPAQ